MAISEAQMRASAKWQAKTYDRVSLRIRKDGEVTRDAINEAAEKAGESLNEYILKAVYNRMREGS